MITTMKLVVLLLVSTCTMTHSTELRSRRLGAPARAKTTEAEDWSIQDAAAVLAGNVMETIRRQLAVAAETTDAATTAEAPVLDKKAKEKAKKLKEKAKKAAAKKKRAAKKKKLLQKATRKCKKQCTGLPKMEYAKCWKMCVSKAKKGLETSAAKQEQMQAVDSGKVADSGETADSGKVADSGDVADSGKVSDSGKVAEADQQEAEVAAAPVSPPTDVPPPDSSILGTTEAGGK